MSSNTLLQSCKVISEYLQTHYDVWFAKGRRAKKSPTGRDRQGGNAFMKTLSRKGLGSEVDEKLWDEINNPIFFKSLGSDPAHGYDAEVLVEVCKAVQRASDAGKITKSQEPIANQSRAIINALAKVGIIALIDEATGYQSERSPDALRLLGFVLHILQSYLALKS